MRFYTIGYGGRKPEQFLEVLKATKVKTVADVRLRPDRSNMGVYVKANSSAKGIEALLARVDIEYRSFIELGNVFMDHPDGWQERYRLLLKQAGSLLTERLLAEAARPFCLLCSEKLPGACHRSLIADYLVAQGHRLVAHL